MSSTRCETRTTDRWSSEDTPTSSGWQRDSKRPSPASLSRLYVSRRASYFLCDSPLHFSAPKNSLERFDEDFIEARRVRLEKFLNNVTRHAKLKRCTHVETFIRSPDAAFAVLRAESIPSLVGKATSWIGNVISSHTVNMVCFLIH